MDMDYQKEMFAVFQAGADRGNRISMRILGILYYNGEGVARDYTTARKWWEKAADKGDASAMSNLGSLYLGGQGVAQDSAKALELFKKAADKGEALRHDQPGSALRKRSRRTQRLRQGARVVREGC